MSQESSPPIRNLPQLVSVETVARQLDVEVDFVKRLTRNGKLKGVKLGHRTLRVTMDSLRRYLEGLVE